MSLRVLGFLVAFGAALPMAHGQDGADLGLEVENPVQTVVLPLRGRKLKQSQLAKEFETRLQEARSAQSLVRIEALADLPTKNRREVRKKQRIKRCKARVDCIARWGRRFKLREIILPQVKLTEDGALEVLISVINVRSAAVDRRAIFTTRSESMTLDIKANYELIFGVPPDPEIDLVDEPEPAPPPASVPAVAKATPEVDDEPKSDGGAEEPPPAAAVAEVAPRELDSSPKPGATVSARRKQALEARNQSEGTISTLAWVGYSTLAVGLVSAAVGGFLVDQGQTTADETDASLSQVAARAQLDDASSQVDQGNLLLVIGGGVALVGLGSLLVESIFEDDSDATVEPIVGPGQIGAVVRW